MDALDIKLNDAFAGKVVRKDLVRKVKVGANIPVFVLEYLLGKYCATEDEAAVARALELTGLTKIVDQNVLTLSGGELQRLRLATAPNCAPARA